MFGVTGVSLGEVDTRAGAGQEIVISNANGLALLAHDVFASLAELYAGLSGAGDNREDANARLRHIAHHLGALIDETAQMILGPHARPAPPPPTGVSLKREIVRLGAIWQDRFAAHGRGLRLTGLDALPAQAALDLLSLERTLTNLLSNALRHGAGDATLSVTRDPSQMTFTLTDNGAGYPEALLALSQNPEHPPAPQVTGSGLRAACQSVLRLGGRMRLSNLATGGARTIVSIPAPTPIAQAPHTTMPDPDLVGKRVLLIEDQASLRHHAAHLLSDLGLVVETASNGARARAHVATERFDLILLDLEMPDTSGVGMVAEMAASAPVVVLTAHRDPSIIGAALAEGASEVATKPMSARAGLRVTLRRALSLPDAVLPLPASAAPPMSPLAAATDGLSTDAQVAYLRQVHADLGTHLAAADAALNAPLNAVAAQDLARAAHALASLLAACGNETGRRTALDLAQTASTASTREVVAQVARLGHNVRHSQFEIDYFLDFESLTDD